MSADIQAAWANSAGMQHKVCVMWLSVCQMYMEMTANRGTNHNTQCFLCRLQYSSLFKAESFSALYFS